MALPRRLWPWLVPLLLVVLVGVLAILQYRWLGQVSQAERAEMRATLERRARDMASEFDREVATLQDLVRGATDGFTQAVPGRMPDAFDAWRRSARYPALVDAIYVGHRDGRSTTLSRYNETTRALDPTEWPPDWPSDFAPPQIARRTLLEPAASRMATAITTLRVPLVLTDPLLYVVWLPTQVALPAGATAAPEARLLDRGADGHFVAVRLDRSTLSNAILPDLVRRHFGDGPTHVAVHDSDGRSVYANTSAALQIDTADVRTSFFAPGTDLPMGSDTDTVFAWSTRVTGRDAGPAGAVAEQRSQIAVRLTKDSGRDVDVLKGFTRPWQILVQHEAGSLEAAVAAGRRRNLWLSFGILTVLVAGMGLVAANARRSERLAAQQVDFVAAVSHELRTPLSVIRSAAQNLASGVVQEPGRTRESGSLIEREGRRLTEMVDQVLGYAGIDALGRGLATTSVDVAATLEAALASCADALAAHGMEVERTVSPDLPAVVANEPALRRALQNMMGNAVKYAADGRWLGLRLEPAMLRARPAVRVIVADRGPGIAPADVPHVFDPFYRGREAVDRQIQGSGIGLSLVRKVAAAHGGTVEVQSSPRGTTFTLTLPASTEHPPGRPAKPARHEDRPA